MTALTQFDRLEASGLWRATPDAQRRDVVVSLGDATLTISDIKGEILAHWSLGAVRRAAGPKVPAIFHPDTDPGQTLELSENEREMIEGIDRLLKAIDRRRPQPGKLRMTLTALTVVAVAGAAVFWLPEALERYTVKVVPAVKRTEIGQTLISHLQRVTGAPCTNPQARAPLDRLARRLLGPDAAGRLVVLRDWDGQSAHLPGRFILLDRAIVEDHEDPDVVAGYIVAEALRAAERDPLADLLDFAGLRASLVLLTTGSLPDATLETYAERLLTLPPAEMPPEALLRAFADAELRSTPYAYARDITGESTLPLIEADPRATEGSRAVLTDSDWVRLQGICGA
jgi:hypothetical protein